MLRFVRHLTAGSCAARSAVLAAVVGIASTAGADQMMTTQVSATKGAGGCRIVSVRG